MRSKAPQYGHNLVHLCLNQARLPHVMSVQFSMAPAQAPMKLWLPLCRIICLSGPSCPLHLTGVSSDLLGGGDGAEATSVLLMPGGVCATKISTVWQSPLLQPHTAALHHAGKRDPAEWIRKACGSRGSEVTARDAQRGRCRLETVISSACESDVQLWEKQL